MSGGKKIVVIIGSATKNSSNWKLIQQAIKTSSIDFEIYDDLSIFPHFDTQQTDHNTPVEILKIREDIKGSAGVLFSTPEYIFSIPSRLKNLLEWCVSTTIFSEKPVAVITASAQGEKAHEELLLILRTLGAATESDHQLLIKGIKGKFDENGNIENNTFAMISKLMISFENSIFHN